MPIKSSFINTICSVIYYFINLLFSSIFHNKAKVIGSIPGISIFFHCLGSPGIITTNPMNIQINIQVDKITFRKLVIVPGVFQIVLCIRYKSEFQIPEVPSFPEPEYCPDFPLNNSPYKNSPAAIAHRATI